MAGQTGSKRKKRGGIVGINVTPMVDIMLVLLVIMMVSSTYIVSRALQVELPKSTSADDSSQGPLIVTLTKDHQLQINQQVVSTDAELVRRFRQARSLPGEPSVVISADGGAQHRWVVHIIDLAKQQSISKFAINVASE